MSRSGFLNKVLGQNIFRGAVSRSLVMAMFRYMPITAIFLHSFYVVAIKILLFCEQYKLNHRSTVYSTLNTFN